MGKDDGVVTVTAAYHSQSPRCGCEVVAEAQGCRLKARGHYGFGSEDTVGRSRCRDRKTVHTYP